MGAAAPSLASHRAGFSAYCRRTLPFPVPSSPACPVQRSSPLENVLACSAPAHLGPGLSSLLPRNSGSLPHPAPEPSVSLQRPPSPPPGRNNAPRECVMAFSQLPQVPILFGFPTARPCYRADACLSEGCSFCVPDLCPVKSPLYRGKARPPSPAIRLSTAYDSQISK